MDASLRKVRGTVPYMAPEGIDLVYPFRPDSSG